jgi:hypothetical protein
MDRDHPVGGRMAGAWVEAVFAFAIAAAARHGHLVPVAVLFSDLSALAPMQVAARILVRHGDGVEEVLTEQWEREGRRKAPKG